MGLGGLVMVLSSGVLRSELNVPWEQLPMGYWPWNLLPNLWYWALYLEMCLHQSETQCPPEFPVNNCAMMVLL